MESYTVWPFVTDLFHFASCFQGSPMLSFLLIQFCVELFNKYQGWKSIQENPMFKHGLPLKALSGQVIFPKQATNIEKVGFNPV